MDIFKAIFASDDEDSDEDAEEDEKPVVDLPAISITDDGAPSVSASGDVKPSTDEGPVDLASFKPKFVPKSHRDRDADSNNNTQKTKSVKRNKSEVKAKKTLVSFDVDEEDNGGLSLSVVPDVKNSKKKKKDKGKDGEKKRRREEDAGKEDVKRVRSTASTAALTLNADEEDEWVEKSPPRENDSRRPARPRASDFL